MAVAQSASVQAVSDNREAQADIPWTSNEQMWDVMSDSNKRHALVVLMAVRCFGRNKTASSFMKAVFDTNFRHHIWQYT